MKPEVEDHIRSLVNFPSPPGVAAHIIALARDPEIELGKVAKALSMDSALAAKVLRIANSPLYAQRRKSENLRQALVVLGLNATLTLALSFSLVKALRTGRSNGLNHPWYWRRVLLAATSARALADAMHHPLAEEIALAALLQDVGMLALDQAVPDLYRGSEVLQRDHTALAEMEMKRLQTDHALVGAWLMQTWRLPDRLHAAIGASHHIDPAFTADPDRIFERCVALSGPLADLFLLEPAQRRFAETALGAERSLGIDKMTFGQVLATVGAMIPETEAIFESTSLASQHPELIIEQAREVLMLRSLTALRELAAVHATPAAPTPLTTDLEEETRRDALTGAYNRVHFERVFELAFDNCARHHWPLTVALVDLDNFRRINERYGQQSGDRILQATARILRGHTRESDIVARLDGGEFAVIMPSTDASTAQAVCEQMVAAFGDTQHLIGSEQATATVSIGRATHGAQDRHADPARLLQAARRALQAAKAGGRNRSASAPAGPAQARS